MSVKKTQQNLSTTLGKTEQTLDGLEKSLGNNEEASLLAIAENSEGNDGLPEGWCETTLGKITDYGKTKKVERKDVSDDLWLLELEDVEKGSSKIIQRLSVSERAFKSTKNKFEKGSVLYGKLRPYLNKIVMAPEDGVCTTEIIPINVEPFGSNKYLFYWLKSGEFLGYVNKVSYGVNMPRLGTKDGLSAPLVLPPIAEQTVIAQTLDTLLAQVDNIKTRLDAIPKILKTFRQSVLAAAVSGKLTEEWRGENDCGEIEVDIKEILESRSKLVSKRTMTPEKHLDSDEYEIPEAWKWVSLDSLASKIVDGVHHKPEYVAEGIPFMSVKDINHGQMSFNYCKYISEDTHKEIHPRCNPEKGDLLITKSGTIGRTAIVDTDDIFDLFVSVALIKPASNKVNMKYIDIALCQWVNSIDVSSRIVGTAIKNLHLRDMRVLAIPFAPSEEQTQIVRRVEELFAFADQIEQQVKNAQERVNNLTQSILAKAFRGELTSQWRADNPELISGDNSAKALLAKIQEERDALKQKAKPKKKSTAKKTKKKVAEK